MCLTVGFFRCSLFGVLGFLGQDVCFSPQFREVFSHYFFKYAFCLFSSLLSSGTSIMYMFTCFVVPERPLSIFIVHSFSFLLSTWINSTALFSSLLIIPFAQSTLLLNLSTELSSSIIFTLFFSSMIAVSYLSIFSLFLKFSLCSCIALLNQ